MRAGVRDKDVARLRLVPSGSAEPGEVRPTSLDDSQLLAKMRAGDKSAAPAFYYRVRPQIDRTLVRLFGKRDVDYDDLRQLFLIELVFTLLCFSGECSLDAWVGAE